MTDLHALESEESENNKNEISVCTLLLYCLLRCLVDNA